MELVINISRLENIEEEKYNNFLNSMPTTLLYVSLPYLKLIETFLKCEIEIIVVYNSNEIIGILPLAFKRNKIYGDVCNSLPFYGSNGGIIISDVKNNLEIRNQILLKFNELIEAGNIISSTIISNPLDELGNTWLKENLTYNVIDERIGQITHFPECNAELIEQELMKSFDDPRPRNIRKAIKEGVNVFALNTVESLDFLYNTHFDNITAINGIPKEKSFFDLIPKYFNDKEYKIYIAELNGEWIGAILLFYFNKTVEYFTPVVVEKHRNLQPTSLIIFKAMAEAFQNGYINWNWGGTWLTQGGVYDFKKKWGTTDHQYYYYTNIRSKSIYNLTKETLLSEYPYFFVIPFSKLSNDTQN